MIKVFSNLLSRFLLWRVKHISQEHFVLMLSIVVGLITGLVAVMLKYSAHKIQHFVSSGENNHVYYFVFPLIGILIVLLIRRIAKLPMGEGVPALLYAISRRNGILPPNKMVDNAVGSAVTVGFGGSVGLEGPIVSTGAAIGSNLARVMRLDYKSRTLLMSCASAAGISAIFNAPIAGIIFTIEIFSLDLTLSSLVPLLLASSSGAISSIYFSSDNNYLLPYDVTELFNVNHTPAYIGLAILCALFSVFFQKTYFKITGLFEKKKNLNLTRAIIGGVLLGALVLLIPPLYGEGYETVNALLTGNEELVVHQNLFKENITNIYGLLALLLALSLVKIVATSITLGAGGVGGIFAPALFTGSVLGYTYAKALSAFDIMHVNPSMFSLMGMAGLLAGVLHAPLTAVFMIAEVSGGYKLFVPIMITAALAYFFTKSMTPYSIYHIALAKKGDLLTHNKDKTILTLMKLESVIEKDFVPVYQTMNLGDLVEVFKKSSRNLYPVLDKDERLVGVLTLEEFKQLLFDHRLHKTISVRDLMLAPPALIDIEESMDSVMAKFNTSGAWNLPVVDKQRYVGFISKSKIFTAYRNKLLEVSN
jgi:CIC family chloride channel protein